MSFSAYDSVKEQIRDAIDIVELVGRYVPLKRQGANYVGRCPWHDDSDPSLKVNPQRQSFRCFVCSIGGDIFTFIMLIEKVEFREALEILAERAGIDLPKKRDFIQLNRGAAALGAPGSIDPTLDPNALLNETEDGEYGEYGGSGSQGGTQRPAPGQGAEVVSKRTLYLAMQWAEEQYQQALLTMEEAAPARQYLEDRGITAASIRQFRIGYAPLERDWWIKQLKGSEKRIAILEAVGILTRRQDDGNAEDRPQRWNQQPYDRFRGRVLFSIRDTQDRTVAFGGRVLPNSPFASRAKYLNSPETPIFSKQRMLYGLDIARLTMGKTRRALIMEGYTDCIMAHQHGFTDAVAALGTAVGAEHVRLLKRFADKIVLILDGDDAGRKRTNEVLEHFVSQGVDMSVLTLPGGVDPCDFLEEHGADAFRMLIETESVDALEHAFRSAIHGLDLQNDVVGTTRALDQLLTVLAKAPASVGRVDEQRIFRLEKIIQRISQRFGVDESRVRQRLKQLRENAERYKPPRTEIRESGESGDTADLIAEEDPTGQMWNDPALLPDRLEREMLELWLADPAIIYKFWGEISEDWLRSPITRAINRKANEMVEREKVPGFESLLTAFDDPRMKALLVELDEAGRAKRMVRPAPTVDAEGNTLEHEAREEPYSEEVQTQLIRQIVAGFERRRFKREERFEIEKLRDTNLTPEEEINTFAALLERQKKKHGK